MINSLRRASLHDLLPLGAGLLGGLAYLFLAIGHAHGQVSVIDEGLYLYKGYLFARGDFQPFQDYGPLTNHMPLSFLIPGWVQLIFGPGIRTGRYFAVFLAGLLLLGLWLITRRLTNAWWASAAVWAVVINPALLKIYSQAISQVLIACMLVWTLFFVLGEDRKRWHLLSGVALSGLMLLTRINMAAVMLLLIAYSFWKYGRGFGFYSVIVGVIVVGIGHAIYWPEILKIWAKWIPQSLSPFLDAFRLPAGTTPFWDPGIRAIHRIDSLLSTLRLHLISFTGFAGMLIALVFRRQLHGSGRQNHSRWLLVSMFAVLFVMHAAASLGLNYCAYCLKNYAAFFAPVGIMLFMLFGMEIKQSRKASTVAVAIGVLIFIPIAFGLPLGEKLVESILSTDITRISALRPQPGTVELAVLLENNFNLGFNQLFHAARIALPGVLVFTPLLAFLAVYLPSKRRLARWENLRNALLASVLAFLLVEYSLATVYFGNSYQMYDCGKDVILANENAGQDLAQTIGTNSHVYWGLGESPVPLLYAPHAIVHPPQLNGDYTVIIDGSPEEIERLGYWNPSLADDWLDGADYVLLSAGDSSVYPASDLDLEPFDRIGRTSPTDPCARDSAILIYKRP
jgi:hypothetical protein